MKIYLAGASLKGKILENEYLKKQENCKEINILESFYYQDAKIAKAIPSLGSFMLDSGAFTFMMSQKKNIQWEDYLDRYAGYINKNKVDLFFELDIDSVVGYKKVLLLRQRLEKATNKEPIPVWHKTRGKEEYKKMCQQYKYVAVGGLAAKEIQRTEYKFLSWFIDTAHTYKAKVHGLGFTNLEGIKKYHFDSVDSTAWLSGNRFGAIYKFNGKTMLKFNVPSGQRLANHYAVGVNNFKEWVKFCKYAEKNL